MATARSNEVICSLVEDGTLHLKGSRDLFHTGVAISADKLMVTERKLRVHSRHDGKLVATSHQLDDRPVSMCLISKTEVAVCLKNSTIEILSFQSTRHIQLVNRLHVTTGFIKCDSVAKVESMDKLIVSGWKLDDSDVSLYLCVVSLTDGHVDTIHHICKGGLGSRSHLAIKYNTVYISCDDGRDSPNTGVYSYSIPNPNTRKFVYHHSDLKRPRGLTVDTRGYIFVCNEFPYSIHQLTDRGELVTIHRLSSWPIDIFYEEQDGVLYIKGIYGSNVITRYRLEYSHQQDPVIPTEVLKMDKRSLDMYKDALRDGKEKVYSIRVMVVGDYGVGKTTLTRRLLGKDVKISDRDSTEGIDVHTKCCKVSLATGEWTTQEENAEQYSRLQRLVKLLNERVERQESEGEQEGQSEIDDLVTSEEHDNGHPQHDHPVSAEQGIDQEVKPTFSHSVETPVVRVGPEPSSEIGSNENEKKKDAVMEILQLVNENSGKLEKSMVEYAALALWDFAGHYVFYTTHQTFLTSRAIYLLVIDLSQQVTDFIEDDKCFLDNKGIKRCKVHELIEIWLNSIHSCAPSSQAGIPPVILVGTHVDKIPEKFRQKIIDKYFMTIREMLGDKPAILHLMDDIAIDNTQADSRLEDLKKRIFELAKQQPHWGEEKPARWLPLEQAIITLKMSGVKVAPLSLVEKINRSGSVRIEDRDELDLFLRFQHEMGTILYFSVEGLRENIVLDPQWMIDALKSLITAETFIKKNPAIKSKWLEFSKRGILTYELLDAIWSKEESPEFHDNKDHIILVMEKLNIIARPRTYGQDGKEVKVENYFLAPCMLSEKTPQEIISPKPQPEVKSSSVLCYVFIEKYQPSPIFHRLLAACVAYWPIAQRKSENLIFCGCCVFDLDLHHRLTMFFREHVIFVRVTRMGTTEKIPSPKLCIEVKEFITMTLSNIIGYLEQNLRFELCIQCPKSDGDSVNSLIPVADLQGNEGVPCHVHDVSHVIMSSEVLKFWFQEEEQSDDALSSLPLNVQDKKPSERQLGQLSVKIGQVSLLLLGLELGLLGADIHQVQKEYSHTVTQCLVVLIKWQQQSKDRATFKYLEKAFQLVGIDVAVLKSIATGEPRENEEDIVSCLPSNLQDKKPSERQLGRLSVKIGQKFLLLGLELGVSWVDIQQIQKKYSHIMTQCLMVLVKWQQQKEDRATFKTLEQAFQLVDIDVDILKSIDTAVLSMPLHLKDKKPSEGQLDELSKKIGEEFLLLALELGLSWADIQQIQNDYSHTITECRRMILVKWQQQSDDRGTFKDLEKAFQLVGIDVNILKSIGTGIPLEILNMDDNSIRLFKEALKAGTERVFSIRVMVVGQYHVGKTTLVKRLLGENVNMSDTCSTDGIDVHVHCCNVSLNTNEWTRQKNDSEQYHRLKRLVKLLNEHVQNQEASGEQEGQSGLNKEHDNGHRAVTSQRQVISQVVQNTPIKRSNPLPLIQPIQLSSNVDKRHEEHSGQKNSNVGIPVSEAKSGTSEKREDAAMEILQLINENSDQIEKSIVEYAALSMWDFAGQYIFYTTHQTFLTSRAIYLLVIDLNQQITDLIEDDECFLDTEGKKECKVYDLIEIWLNSIHSCAPSHQDGIPPVILVGTHVDKIPEKFRQENIDKYFIKLRDMLKDKPVRFHLMDDFAIDNTQCDPRLEELKRRIFELASEQTHWGEERPARWLPLEQAIMKLKASGVKVATLSDVEKINRSGSVRIENKDELDLFLRFQHEMGMILYFSVEGLREKIVLDPQWLINALKSLITSEMFIRKNPAIISKWFDFRDKGILTQELIDAVWTRENNPELYANKEHILLIMEQLNIIAKPRSFSKIGEKEEGYYLAPCMLRREMPKEIISPESDAQIENTSILCFVCTAKFLPPPIFHRLVGACLTRWFIAQQNEENLIYCGCCVFYLDHHHRLTLYFRSYAIFARITRMGVTDMSQSSKLCSEARKFIDENLSKIIKNLGQSLQFEPHVQCPFSDADSHKGLIAVPLLQKNKNVACHSHKKSHTLVSRDILKFWYEDEGQSEKESTEPQTEEVDPTKQGPSTSRQEGTEKRKRRLKGDRDEHATKKLFSKQPETLGSTRTDSDKSIQANRIHNQLCLTLHGYIREEPFTNIKQMAKTYLDRNTVAKATNMIDLWSDLEVKGVIGVGKYNKLIEIMTGAGVEIGKDEIRQAAKDINDIMQNHIPSQEQIEMSSLDAHTSHQDSIHPCPEKKKKPMSESSSDLNSDSEWVTSSDSESTSEDEMASDRRKKKEKRKKAKKQKLKRKRNRRGENIQEKKKKPVSESSSDLSSDSEWVTSSDSESTSKDEVASHRCKKKEKRKKAKKQKLEKKKKQKRRKYSSKQSETGD